MTKTKTIKITVWRGIVTDVTNLPPNLPPGWSYRIDDRDSAQLGGDAEDFCPRCGLWLQLLETTARDDRTCQRCGFRVMT